MKAGSPEVISDLQDAAAILYQLKAQFKSDACQIKFSGPKWLARKFKSWAFHAGCHLHKVENQLRKFDAFPDYDRQKPEDADDLEGFLDRAEQLLTGAHDTLCEFRKSSWDTKADYVPDIYEHAIHDLGDDLKEAEIEIDLLGKLGAAGYTGARLEDS